MSGRIEDLESNFDYMESMGRCEISSPESLASKVDYGKTTKSPEKREKVEHRGNAHKEYQEYFKKSVTEKFINERKMPTYEEHCEIKSKLDSLIAKIGSFGDQDPYVQNTRRIYEEFAAIRFLQDRVQNFIAGTLMDDKEKKKHEEEIKTISDMFEKVRKDLDQYLEKNPHLEYLRKEFNQISDDYLSFIRTRQKEETAGEFYSLNKTEQKEENIGDSDYSFRLRALREKLQAFKLRSDEKDWQDFLSEFKKIQKDYPDKEKDPDFKEISQVYLNLLGAKQREVKAKEEREIIESRVHYLGQQDETLRKGINKEGRYKVEDITLGVWLMKEGNFDLVLEVRPPHVYKKTEFKGYKWDRIEDFVQNARLKLKGE